MAILCALLCSTAYGAFNYGNSRFIAVGSPKRMAAEGHPLEQ